MWTVSAACFAVERRPDAQRDRSQSLTREEHNGHGLIGGLGPDTTVDYYRRILAAWHTHDPATAPHLVIDSIDVQMALHVDAIVKRLGA